MRFLTLILCMLVIYSGQSFAGDHGDKEDPDRASRLDRSRKVGEVLSKLRPGSTIQFQPDGRVDIAGPGRDTKSGFWASKAHYSPYRDMAKCTGTFVSVGDESTVNKIVCNILDRVSNGGSQGAPRIIDVVFLIDTSGSMGSKVAPLQKYFEDMMPQLEELEEKGAKIRYGLVSFDSSASSVLFRRGLTSSIPRFKAALDEVFTYNHRKKHKPLLSDEELKNPGKQTPVNFDTEAQLDAIVSAGQKMFWKDDTIKKIILISDEPTQAETFTSFNVTAPDQDTGKKKRYQGNLGPNEIGGYLKNLGIEFYPVLVRPY